MSVKSLGKIYECDVCGKVETSDKPPHWFTDVRVDAHRGGFKYGKTIHVCDVCLSSHLFTDPPSAALPSPNFINKILNFLNK